MDIVEISDLTDQCIKRNVGQKDRLEFIKFQIEKTNQISQSDEDYISSLREPLEKSITFATNAIESELTKIQGKPGINNCTFCNKVLKFGRKFKPEKIWHVEGKFCKDCFKEIKAGTSIFDATHNEGITGTDKIKGKLIVQNFKNHKRVIFVAKKNDFRETIPKTRITNFDKIPFNDDSVTGKMKSKVGKKPTKPHLRINYQGMHINKNVIFGIKELETAFKEIDHLMLSK